MRLLIEDGILLKEYALAWSPDGFSVPPAGWTPDERNSWVMIRAAELLEEAHDKELVTSLFFTRQQAAKELGVLLFTQKKPWPGWVPITPRTDKRISRAYRLYFQELNADYSAAQLKMSAQFLQLRVQRLPDGFYTFRNGRMQPVEQANDALPTSN